MKKTITQVAATPAAILPAPFATTPTDPSVALATLAPRVLVAEDHADVRKVLSLCLEHNTCVVYAAHNGEQALHALKTQPPFDLLITDVDIPQMGGVELLKTLRADPNLASLPIIFLSAENSVVEKTTWLRLGVDDYITKPFNFDELIARANSQIRLGRLQKQLLAANQHLQQANQQLIQNNALFAEDMEVARRIQHATLPVKLPQNDSIWVEARYEPAKRLGGDFYDVSAIDNSNKLVFLVADVCGHGVGAAMFTSVTKLAFQSACAVRTNPGWVLENMNQTLYRSIDEGYVTVFYGCLDQKTKVLHYAGAGHPPILLQRKGKARVQALCSTNTSLGWFEKIEGSEKSVELNMGDRLFFSTDGLYECQNEKQHTLGIDRLKQVIASHTHTPLDKVLDALIDQTKQHTNLQALEDDLTLLGVEIGA